MTDRRPPIRDEGEIPDRLAEDLRRAYAPMGRTSNRLDRAVLDAANAELGRAHRLAFPRWAVGGALAAAAALVLGVGLWGMRSAGRPKALPPVAQAPASALPELLDREALADAGIAAAEADPADLNGDGRTDILDALILARAVEQRADGRTRARTATITAELDLNGDGASDAADVEALAARIVALGRVAG